jgi:hypothetical protein
MAIHKDEQQKIGFYNYEKRPSLNERTFKPQTPPPKTEGLNIDFPIQIDVITAPFLLKKPLQTTSD